MEEFRIVAGNDYHINVYMERMAYGQDGSLRSESVDLRDVKSLTLTAFRGAKEVSPAYQIGPGGRYLTVTIGGSAFGGCRCGCSWGIRVAGTLNGLQVAAVEHRVFRIVECNARSYVPFGIVDGEGAYLYNLRFSSADDVPPDSPPDGGDNPPDGGGGGSGGSGGGSGDEPDSPTDACPGWMGFAVFDDVAAVDTSELEQLPTVTGSHVLTNRVRGARLVVVCSTEAVLSFRFGGLEATLDVADSAGRRYYYTDPLIAGEFDLLVKSEK